MACILLWSSAVRVHVSLAYRKMDVTRERISRILELREILLSFQTGLNFVSAAVVCAILENISGLEPSSVINDFFFLQTNKKRRPIFLNYCYLIDRLFENLCLMFVWFSLYLCRG